MKYPYDGHFVIFGYGMIHVHFYHVFEGYFHGVTPEPLKER